MDESREERTPGLTAGHAVLIGYLVVTMPVLGVIAVGAAVGSAFNRGVVGLLMGCLVGWVVWAFLVPRWRDWVSGTTAPMAEVQRLAQRTGLVWRQGSILERTEMRRKNGQLGSAGPAEVYLGLRNQILTLDPRSVGPAIRSGDRTSWGCVIETGSSVGTITLVCLCDGTTSLYTSSGFGIIGGGGHDAVVRENENLLDILDDHLASMSPGVGQSLPGVGRTIIRALTDDGQLSFEADENDLGNGRSVMSPIFHAGHAVITQLRLIDEANR